MPASEDPDATALDYAKQLALEQIFVENGVPWSAEPLLSIMPVGASTDTPTPR
jgi:hypothetical protein